MHMGTSIHGVLYNKTEMTARNISMQLSPDG